MESDKVQTSPMQSQKQAEIDLESECESVWVQVNQVHERVNKGPASGVLGETETPMFSVYQAKAKYLQGEIHTMESKQPQALPTNPTILKALLLKELSTTNKDLEQTLQLVQAQRKEVEEELKREKALLEQHLEVKRSLEAKLQAATDEDTYSPNTSRNAQEKELHRQRKSAVNQQQKLMRQLAGFVSKHFPTPTVKQTSGHRSTSKQTHDDSDEEGTKKYMSLLEIIEVLMNKCIDSESDPYVTVDENSWSPYIELLLRCGLALRHPQDCKRIRLVPFHL